MSLERQPVAEAAHAAFAKQRPCIYLQHPFAECYCMNISGTKIPRMLDYCVGDYPSCPVYRSRASLELRDAEAGALPE